MTTDGPERMNQNRGCSRYCDAREGRGGQQAAAVLGEGELDLCS